MPYQLIRHQYGKHTAKIRHQYGNYGDYPGVFRGYSKDIQGDNDFYFQENIVNFETIFNCFFSPFVKLQQK